MVYSIGRIFRRIEFVAADFGRIVVYNGRILYAEMTDLEKKKSGNTGCGVWEVVSSWLFVLDL